MKILIAHNFHRNSSASGDDIVVKNEIALLREKGHEVIVFAKYNSDYDSFGLFRRLHTVVQIPWSIRAYNEIGKVMINENPDIIHVHNFFPLLTPSIYQASYNLNKPLVQTVHDYRFFCPNAFFLKDDAVCEICTESGLYQAVINRCFDNSVVKSAWASLAIANMWRFRLIERIDAFVVFSQFSKCKMVSLGLPFSKIFIKPHFLYKTDEVRSRELNDKCGGYFLYAGRISKEKGVPLLLGVWRKLKNVPLKIAGSGPLTEQVKRAAVGMDSVEFLGYVPHAKVFDLMKCAYAVITPSICDETFGLTILEAYSMAVPVITARTGAFVDLVSDGKTGLLFNRNDGDGLKRNVEWLWKHKTERRRMSRNAMREYEMKYTASANYDILSYIYRRILCAHRKKIR